MIGHHLRCPQCGSTQIAVWPLHDEATELEHIGRCSKCNYSHFVEYFIVQLSTETVDKL
jgi:hypothetical protein